MVNQEEYFFGSGCRNPYNLKFYNNRVKRLQFDDVLYSISDPFELVENFKFLSSTKNRNDNEEESVIKVDKRASFIQRKSTIMAGISSSLNLKSTAKDSNTLQSKTITNFNNNLNDGDSSNILTNSSKMNKSESIQQQQKIYREDTVDMKDVFSVIEEEESVFDTNKQEEIKDQTFNKEEME